MSVELNIGAIEIRDGDNMKPIGVIGSGGSLDTSEIQELLDSKTSKTRIDFDGNRTFKIGTKTLNYKELHDVHLAQQDFAFVVYGDRAYLLSYVQDDASSMRELRFQSVIATTDSNGVSNTKTSGIYVKSSDGINIASVTVTDINSENNSYKASAINDTNKNNVWYPSNKAVADYVDSSVAELNDDLTQLGKKHDEEISDVDARLKILEGLTDVSELTFKDIQKIVQSGLAQKYFSIGDQITTKWRDGATEYDWIWDVVSFEDSELESGDIVPSMILQAHYASPFGIQFNRNGALYVVEDEPLVAGTYNFTIGTTWGTYCKAGTTYQFTLPTDLPVGGQFVIGTASSTTGGCPDNNPTSWRIHVFESNTATVAREILTLSEGSDGTSLGITTSSIKYADNPKINNLQCASYGYNRWAKSAIRKYLNSDLEKLLWWEPQYKFDGPPLELTTKDGFMRGFDKDFLSVVKPIKIKTCCNYVTEGGTSSSPAIDETYDTFWLPSLEQEYCAPQVSGIEGTYFPYWKEVLGLDEPQVSGSSNANPNHIRYALNSKASAQTVRLRSANRGYGSNAWFVYSTGYVNNNNATNSIRFAPACAIC